MSRKRVKVTKKNFPIIFMLTAIIFLADVVMENYDTEKHDTIVQNVETNSQSVSQTIETEDMTVHFLDVGQGLSILVQLGDEVLIYDGGESDVSSFVVSYLKQQGITEIDYMISSHYDSDHVSGLIGCLNAFDVKNVICSDYVHESRTYESFIEAIEKEGLEAQYMEVGTQIAFGDAVITILAPVEIVSDSNSNSVAIKLEYGESSFIFTGDADYRSERKMIASGMDLDCDVLSLGHHGSSNSTSSDFLQKTVPEYVVISCGEGNSYGHPHVEVVEMLEAMEIDVFRSDVQGTVIATTDGKTITWSQEPCNDYTDGE